MPKQVKKRTTEKGEKKSCLLGIFSMLSALVLSGFLILLIQLAGSDEQPKWLGYAIPAAYVVFTVVSLIHCLHGIVLFKKTESYAAVFTAMLTAISVFAALINIQFMLALTFSTAGAESMVTKIIGDISLDEFMASQTNAWKFMIGGISTSFAVGMISVIRLIKK